MRKRKIQKTVREILLNDPYSRENDGYLIMRVVQELEPELFNTKFETAMKNMQWTGISFESITRARRKFFEEYPELKVEKAEEARRIKEAEYITEYSHIPSV